MSKELWTDVDTYIIAHLFAPDPALDDVLKANAAAGLPSIDVSPAQGKFLHILARIKGATRILEIGTLGGYSTIWLARALPPEGKLITLEFDPKHAAVATANVARAGLAGRVEIRVGAALNTLPVLYAESHEPFDFIFIDADKDNYPGYLKWAIQFSRPGTLILADNVVREGEILNPDSPDPRVQGVRRFIEMVQADPRLDATVLQTVGSKGYDGFAIALVTA
jgi:predicted O-methyltransferase YrrM